MNGGRDVFISLDILFSAHAYFSKPLVSSHSIYSLTLPVPVSGTAATPMALAAAFSLQGKLSLPFLC